MVCPLWAAVLGSGTRVDADNRGNTNPLTGEPDAGDPPVRFGGRGKVQFLVPTPIGDNVEMRRSSHAQLRFCFRGLVGNSGWAARQQLKIDGGKFAPATALNGCIRVRPSICSGGHPACRSQRHPCRPTLNPQPSSINLSQTPGWTCLPAGRSPGDTAASNAAATAGGARPRQRIGSTNASADASIGTSSNNDFL